MPIDNTALLEDLMRVRALRIADAPILHCNTPALATSDRWDQIEGMLLGVAIGDSLGVTTEATNPWARRHQHGEITDYLPNRYAEGRRVGLPSDDTQLTFWTIESLLENGGLDPAKLGGHLATRGRIFGIGRSVRQYLRNRAEGLRWEEAGVASAGNGALMRVAPLLLPHLATGGTAIWADVALGSMVTHNDEASTSACLAFASMLRELLACDTVPEPMWWIDAYVEAARDLEGATSYRPRDGDWDDTWNGPLWDFVDRHVREAVSDTSRTTVEHCQRWYSGAYLLETIPSVLLILARHGASLEEAITRAVNDTRDNDTVAAIVGCAVGALHGAKSIPERWRGGLLGRTTDCDDGHVFELLRQLRRAPFLNP